jgi:hypothetical protein
MVWLGSYWSMFICDVMIVLHQGQDSSCQNSHCKHRRFEYLREIHWNCRVLVDFTIILYQYEGISLIDTICAISPVHLPHSWQPPILSSLTLQWPRPLHHPMCSLGCRVGYTLMMARRWMGRWQVVGDRNTSTDVPRSFCPVVPAANWQVNSKDVVWLEGQGQQCPPAHFYVMPPPHLDTQ